MLQRCQTQERASSPSPYLPVALVDLADPDSGTARSRSKIASRLRTQNSLSAAGKVKACWPTPRSRNGVYFGFSLVEPVRLHFVGMYGICLIL
jgi:hypothetical protein